MLRQFLIRIRLLSPRPPTDQIYSEAKVENAMIDRDKQIARIKDIAESGKTSNDALRAGIARVNTSSLRKDPMAELVHGMKSR
jgi:hypothetical protein